MTRKNKNMTTNQVIILKFFDVIMYNDISWVVEFQRWWVLKARYLEQLIQQTTY